MAGELFLPPIYDVAKLHNFFYPPPPFVFFLPPLPLPYPPTIFFSPSPIPPSTFFPFSIPPSLPTIFLLELKWLPSISTCKKQGFFFQFCEVKKVVTNVKKSVNMVTFAFFLKEKTYKFFGIFLWLSDKISPLLETFVEKVVRFP